MASGLFQTGMQKIVDRTTDYVGSAAVKAVLVDSTYAFDKTQSSLTSNGAGGAGTNIAAHEITATGYTGGFNGSGRKALGTKSINLDGTNNRVNLKCAAITWTAIGGASNATIGGVVFVQEVTNDGASIPIAFDDCLANLTTNGSDVTYTPDSTNGIGYIQL